MKFGFDADTLDAVWMSYHAEFRIVSIWLRIGILYSLSFPLLIGILTPINNRFLLAICDLYYNLLGWLILYAALSWKFNKPKADSSTQISNYRTSKGIQLNLVRTTSNIIGFESIVITLNMLLPILSFFIVRLVIYASGALGVYSQIELFFNTLWIIVYPVTVFFWIFSLRLLKHILIKTRIHTCFQFITLFTALIFFVILGVIAHYNPYVIKITETLFEFNYQSLDKFWVSLNQLSNLNVAKYAPDKTSYDIVSIIFSCIQLLIVYKYVVQFRKRYKNTQRTTLITLLISIANYITFSFISYNYYFSSVSSNYVMWITMCFVGFINFAFKITFAIFQFTASTISLSFPINIYEQSIPTNDSYQFYQRPAYLDKLLNSYVIGPNDYLPIQPSPSESFFNSELASIIPYILIKLVITVSYQLMFIVSAKLISTLLMKLLKHQIKRGSKSNEYA